MRRTEDIGQLELSMNFLPRHDGITRAVKQRAVKFYLECAVEHFYPLGLQCDQKQTKEANKIERNIRVSTPTKCSSNCSSEDERADGGLA